MGDSNQNTLNDAEGTSLESKNWKKKKYNSFMTDDSVSSLLVDYACSKHKKKKHARDRQTEIENHEICTYLGANSENMSSIKSQKKKKKRKKLKLEDSQGDQTFIIASSAKKKKQDIDQVYGQNQATKKIKHKMQKNLDDNKDTTVDSTSDQATKAASEENATKKRKKKKQHSENYCTEASLFMETNILEPVSARIEDLSKKEKKKKKKKEKKHDENNELEKEVNEENMQEKFSSPEKKNKKKRNSNDTVSASDSILKWETQYSDMSTVPKIKGRIGGIEGGQGSNAKDLRHNTFKVDKKSAEDNDKTGMKDNAKMSDQWVTASLGTEERDKKFLRLLGGFKKGTESGSMSFKTGPKGGNLAMNREQENIYRKDMENMYERAMGMSLQRGVGLGYEPPPDAGKKFLIDKNKSNSKKFDD